MNPSTRAVIDRLKALIERASEGLPLADRDVLIAANQALGLLEDREPSVVAETQATLRVTKAALHHLHHQLCKHDPKVAIDIAKSQVVDLLTMYEVFVEQR
jgi:hypothetical protein